MFQFWVRSSKPTSPSLFHWIQLTNLDRMIWQRFEDSGNQIVARAWEKKARIGSTINWNQAPDLSLVSLTWYISRQPKARQEAPGAETAPGQALCSWLEQQEGELLKPRKSWRVSQYFFFFSTCSCPRSWQSYCGERCDCIQGGSQVPGILREGNLPLDIRTWGPKRGSQKDPKRVSVPFNLALYTS